MTIKEREKNLYKSLLKKYIQTEDEKLLEHAKKMTIFFIKHHMKPEEIVQTQIEVLKDEFPVLYEEGHDMFQFLIDTMVYYGLTIEKYKSLRKKQLEIDSEIALAANIQQTLLATTIPDIPSMDIGVVSMPAHQMNGDYYHFITGKDNTIGVALADVIGKGIPAALCMSMIKYAMDSFPEMIMSPPEVLHRLNHVVERNVDASMFITMFYAKYNIKNQTFVFSSAGHEPGFYYQAATNTFHNIHTKGLVLGVLPYVEYPQYELKLSAGDMIILFTDGVTECREGNQDAKREELIQVVQNSMGQQSAQQIVEEVYYHFEQKTFYHQQDDFTLMIFKQK